MLVINFASMIAFLGLYTSYVYPHLKFQYGGGYTKPVVLIPNARGRRIAGLAGLPLEADGSIGPVQLLLENRQNLTVIAIKDGHAVSIASDLIDAVVKYTPPKSSANREQNKSETTAPPAKPSTR